MAMKALALLCAIPSLIMLIGTAETLERISAEGDQCLKSSEDDLRKVIDNMRRDDCSDGESTKNGVSVIQDMLRTVQLEMSLMKFRRELDVMRAEIDKLKQCGELDYCTCLDCDTSIEVEKLQEALEAKRCESGWSDFTPHDASSKIDTRHFDFSTPFVSVPEITSGLTGLDVDNKANVRVRVDVTNVNTTGFDISVSEWGDTHIYSLKVSWMACSN